MRRCGAKIAPPDPERRAPSPGLAARACTGCAVGGEPVAAQAGSRPRPVYPQSGIRPVPFRSGAVAGQAFRVDRSGRAVAGQSRKTGVRPVRDGLDSAKFGAFPPDPPIVSCDREITAVYGFDDGLDSRLAEFAAALWSAGWSDTADGGPARPKPGAGASEPPVTRFRWQPAPGLGLPAGLELMPPDRRFDLRGWMSMGVGWASRGESADLAHAWESARHYDPTTASPVYQPVEVGGDAVGALMEQALAGHQHAIAIGIKVGYYNNMNTRARPSRLRRRPLPIRARRAGRGVGPP